MFKRGPNTIKKPSSASILCINPWIFDFTAYDFWLKPLGLLYIASILKKHTHFQLSFIDCLDCHHPLLDKELKTKVDGRGPFLKEQVPKPLCLKDIPRRYSRYGIPLPLFLHELSQVPSPDLILVTCTMTYWYPGVQLAIDLIRRKFGQVPVILGGIYATLMPGHAKKATGADIVFEGPGEGKILSLIREVLGDKSCPDFQFQTLEEMPWPAFDLLRSRDFLPLMTSRGCPFKCTFCVTPNLYKNFEQRNPSSVVSEVENHYHRYKTTHFAFYDDALLLNKNRHIKPILKGIIKKNIPLTFHTPNGLHVREIDSELALFFKKANFQSLFLSQESFDKDVLIKACLKVSEYDLEKALANLERAGYKRQQVNVYLLVGLPRQDISSVRESIFHVLNLGAKPKLAYFSPIPGTEEWRYLREKRYLTDNVDPLLHNKLTFPYLWGNGSSDEFESLKKILEKYPQNSGS